MAPTRLGELMKRFKNNVIRAGLGALYFTGAHHALRPIFAGVGTIFVLHHVRPPRDDGFQPNHHLEVTPDFLRATLGYLRASRTDIVSLDEAHRRLAEQDFSRRFACLTLDDGYRDNRDFALPLFREFEAPFTVYVTSDFAQGIGRLWWVALERLIAKTERIELSIDGVEERIDTAGDAAKQAAFERLHRWVRAMSGDDEVAREVSALCARYGIDDLAISRELCMPWDELRAFAEDPLVTIGAHGITHSNLAKQSEVIAKHEITYSRKCIEAALQRPTEHLAYPYGDKAAAGAREFALAQKAGFKTAVTTRPGMVFAENAGHLTALPRLSLNGNYQDERLLPVLTSGAATAMWNGFRRIDAA
ncbi:peptidoglycan/xylan/chitin deacetylase (PgdA/CDA1 family) [Rhodopseudomonas rhenobacensis]|uniref:Chitooligosaccharide deacetylase n=2 Tax=Rhodopseudomonas rhenobacensis TaxID=87461 RepID=A0A7W8DX23_9BRAD|nr:peptidoglycan/xylan/chitin deacetylase (PgdA/CDA1 family) [Rhodopseudomonas rhenobacensis]